MPDTMGITIQVQMAINKPEMRREELEEILNTANNIDVNIEGIECYPPDMVECTYLEEGMLPE